MNTALHFTMQWNDWLDFFNHYLSLSLLSVGGAITTAPEMHRYLVVQQHWLTEQQFNASIAIAQAAPGPNVLFIALMGWNVGSNAGGLLSGLFGAFVPMTGILLHHLELLGCALGTREPRVAGGTRLQAGDGAHRDCADHRHRLDSLQHPQQSLGRLAALVVDPGHGIDHVAWQGAHAVAARCGRISRMVRTGLSKGQRLSEFFSGISVRPLSIIIQLEYPVK